MVVKAQHGEPAEQDFGKWYDDFKDMVSHGIIKCQNPDNNAWRIPLWWIQLQAGRHAVKGAEKGSGPPEFVIMVMDQDGKLVDTKGCSLYIRGFRSYESVCEDFPPIKWP